MGITDRQGEILNRLVEEYIDSAQPVSSQLIERKSNFGICPATIRIEMQKLTNAGFLYQPHTSAGRVPTDKGYRFFVDKLIEKELEDFEIGDWFKEHPFFSPHRFAREFEQEIDNTIKFIQLITKNLALASSVLALSYFEKEKIFWKEGWEALLKEPEFREEVCIINFTELLENFEKNIEDFKINSKIKIYIGRENPFKKAKDFSIISSKCCLPDEKETIISLLGPKRMAYDKNISLMNSLIKLLKNF